MEELLRDLQRLSHRGAGLRHLFADVRHAAPAHSQGSDRSGAVIAVLGPDGLADTIRVHPGWQDRLPAAAFAAAVGQCPFRGSVELGVSGLAGVGGFVAACLI